MLLSTLRGIMMLIGFSVLAFATFGRAITTKSLPLFDNSTDSSQFVQFRTAINQLPTRNFLVQQKTSLSPVQQTHILDDVQKNQRIHYHHGSSNIAEVPAPQNLGLGPIQSVAEPPIKYANLINLNSFAPPPPVQTVVLSPQQSLPTTPTYTEYPFYKSTTEQPKSHNLQQTNYNSFTQFEPLLVQQHQLLHGGGVPNSIEYPTVAASSVFQQHPDKFVFKYTTPPNRNPKNISTSSVTHKEKDNQNLKKQSTTPSTSAKTYLTKDSSGLFSPFLENPKVPSTEPDTKSIIKEVYIKQNPEDLIAQDRQKFFQQLLDDNKNSDDLIPNDDQTIAQNDLGSLKTQFERELLRQLIPNQLSNNLDLFRNGSSISEFSLPNGQKIQISKDYNKLLENESNDSKIKAIVVKQFPTTKPKSTNILEELTKGVVPPGAEYELIKRNKDGGLEEVSKFPTNIPQKKVTFVILEEQPDGTVKVQGVRGSEKETLKESGEEVDSIIRKIKEGELKLPPSAKLSSKQLNSVQPKTQKSTPTTVKSKYKSENRKETAKHFIPTPVSQSQTTESDYYTVTGPEEETSTPYRLSTTASSTFYESPRTTPSYEENNQIADSGIPWNLISSPYTPAFESSTRRDLNSYGLFHLNNSGYLASLFSALNTPVTVNYPQFDPAGRPNYIQLPTTTETIRVSSKSEKIMVPHSIAPTIEHTEKEIFKPKRDRNNLEKKSYKKPTKELRKDNEEEESTVEETKTEDPLRPNNTLSDMLKKASFYAMARFLKQSGLDTILNDTGPFTLFVPSDKAFRTLLIQLGGPDKAEDKFKENPRLLSGLLLHHVIPGAFRVSTLQDEMTGVSLAGTQLRVNTYTTHDIEWNDIKVVTVNGARIMDEKDIVIPQGIAHAIDRVMFPLPVGNILQSLQADRENRYSNFLKIVEESELSPLLTGGKTFTLFAPLNRAFTHSEFTKVLSDPSECKSFVLRHLVPGALYSAGMKYYQVRDSLEEGHQVTIYKEAGKIKVNTAHVVTRNIPTTNGVIHAIDAFL